jgi:aspartyl-tRNA(Asn)/glutamyl-tRNA(Gln) amidotransferase subunit B
MKDYALGAYDAEVLTQSRELAGYFEAAAKGSPHPQTVANWVLNEILRVVPPDDERAIAACPIKPADLAGLITLIEDGTISGRIAKDVFEKMLVAGESARAIVAREGLTQVADAGELGSVVDQVLAEHAKVVEDYKAGKKAALGFLVGQVMKSTSGKASPAVVNSLLMEKLPKV